MSKKKKEKTNQVTQQNKHIKSASWAVSKFSRSNEVCCDCDAASRHVVGFRIMKKVNKFATFKPLDPRSSPFSDLPVFRLRNVQIQFNNNTKVHFNEASLFDECNQPNCHLIGNVD